MIALMVKELSPVPLLYLFTATLSIYSPFPIVFSLHSIYLAMCVHREITGYFSLAFSKLSKLHLSQHAVTDWHKGTEGLFTHTCSKPEDPLILRAPSCVKKQSILLSDSIVLTQPWCLGTSAGLHRDNIDLRPSLIPVIFLLVVFTPVRVPIHPPLIMGDKNYTHSPSEANCVLCSSHEK